MFYFSTYAPAHHNLPIDGGRGAKIWVEWNREPRNECGHLHFRICGGAESDFLFSPYNTYVPLCFMQGFVNFGDADIPLSAHLIPPMCHGLIQIQFFLPTCLTTQRRARCFSPEERNNVFDKRGPFRFHIPEDRPGTCISTKWLDSKWIYQDMIKKRIMEDILKNPLARHSAKIKSYQFIGDDFHQNK